MTPTHSPLPQPNLLVSPVSSLSKMKLHLSWFSFIPPCSHFIILPLSLTINTAWPPNWYLLLFLVPSKFFQSGCHRDHLQTKKSGPIILGFKVLLWLLRAFRLNPRYVTQKEWHDLTSGCILQNCLLLFSRELSATLALYLLS